MFVFYVRFFFLWDVSDVCVFDGFELVYVCEGWRKIVFMICGVGVVDSLVNSLVFWLFGVRKRIIMLFKFISVLFFYEKIFCFDFIMKVKYV